MDLIQHFHGDTFYSSEVLEIPLRGVRPERPNIYVRAQENGQNVDPKDNYTTPECSISY